MCQLYENTVMEAEAEKNGYITAVSETEAFPAENSGLVFIQGTAMLRNCYNYLKQYFGKEDHIMWEFFFSFAEKSESLGAVGLLDLSKKKCFRCNGEIYKCSGMF